MIRLRHQRFVLALAVVATVFAGCGGDDEKPASTTTSSTSTAPAAVASPLPEDLCSLVPAEDVAAITGEQGVVAEFNPLGCRYPGTDVTTSTNPVIVVRGDVASSGGIDAFQTGAAAALGVEAEVIEVEGEAGYVVVGTVGDAAETQAGAAAGDLVVTVSMAGSHRDAAIALLELVVGRL